MGFIVLPALIPDIRPVYDAYFAAFEADPDGKRLLDILFPDGFTSEEFRAAHTAATLNWWHTSPTQHTFKCVDLDNGAIIGMALCDVFASPQDAQERKNPGVGWLEGDRKERAEKVLNPLWEAREKAFGGKRYIYVHAFAVEPSHQARGAGAALVKAIVDLGNNSRLPIYLESSPGSEKLYQRMGFRRLPGEMGKVVHCAELLGTEQDVEVPLMMRVPDAAPEDQEREKERAARRAEKHSGVGRASTSVGTAEA
ncbi:puromycin N-acetyltransferase [Echria macrotheca]|uniref:Puromycin N-acetyltransferase n=1 Tax=Echria macrotheca TaxID=438768 RepID=A0AAJ0F1D1_9PEZI|nr:puromycin N-acetyltransferase [Echria macrotheca]